MKNRLSVSKLTIYIDTAKYIFNNFQKTFAQKTLI